MYRVPLFDQLIYDTDANLGNVLIGEDWHVWRVDFTRAFRTYKTLQRQIEENAMKTLMRICAILSLVVLAAGLLAASVVPQEGSSQGRAKESASAQGAQKHKQARWEGIIIRSDKDKKTLTVRQRGSNLEKQVMYDDSTRWTSQARHMAARRSITLIPAR